MDRQNRDSRSEASGDRPRRSPAPEGSGDRQRSSAPEGSGDRPRPSGPEAFGERQATSTSSGSKNRPETVSVPMKVVADSKGQEVAIMTTDTSVYTGTIEEYDENTMNTVLVDVTVKRSDGIDLTTDRVFLRGDKILTISLHPILEEHPLVKAFKEMADDFVAAEKAKEDQPPRGGRGGGGRGSFPSRGGFRGSGSGGYGRPSDGDRFRGSGSGGYGRPSDGDRFRR